MESTFSIVDKVGHRNAVIAPAGDEVALLEASAQQEDGFLWVNLTEPDASEMLGIGRQLQLHALAVEDSVHGRQQPKVQWFKQHLFLAVWELLPIPGTQEIQVVELFLFARPGLLITVRRGAGTASPEPLERVMDAASIGLSGGVMSGVHAIVSHVVAGYINVCAAIESELEDLEDQVFDETTRDDAARLYRLRKRIGKVNRAVSTIATAFTNGRDRLHILIADNSELEPYVEDLIDDLAGVNQLSDDQDAALDGVISTHENSVASQQSTDSRKISAVAALLAIPAVVAGLYGMNFTDLPGTHWRYGLFVIFGLIVIIEAWAFVALRRRRWL